MVELLVRNSADLNATNNIKETALIYAADFGIFRISNHKIDQSLYLEIIKTDFYLFRLPRNSTTVNRKWCKRKCKRLER